MGKDQELLDAARNGNFSTVEKILISKAKRSGPLASLRRGPGANVQDASGYSALHHAALNGHKEIVELLLTNEASANIVDVKGSSPLHLAAWSGNVDVVRMLLSHGPSIPNVNLLTKDNETALHCAAQYGHTEVVCLLLEFSCDPTIRNTKQETALDLAAQYGRLDTVDMLVRTHPELIQLYNGSSTLNLIFPHTPLHLASRNGHKAVVEVLLTGGININVRTSSGTALHEAALCGKTEVVRTLLENGIDLNIKDNQSNTVVDLLKQFPCHVDIYSVIKKYHRAMYNERDDLFLPSKSTSPFDNFSSNIDSTSLISVSPMHYDPYERRLSSSCSISAVSDTQHNRYTNYNQTGLSKSLMETNYLQDDMFSRSQDFDSVSVCSTASSSCSRDRRSPYNMHMGVGSQLPSPGSISNKISPTPPKKPPRRNLSISPTHVMPSMSLSSEQNGFDTYEYAFIKINSSQDQIDGPESQEYSNSKRKSRDIETETEEELLLLVFPGAMYDGTSNGSLSSSISLSDKSVSTDNNTVEEYVGDVPFAGLFKGSVTPDSETGPHYGKLERPTTLRQLKTVYTPNNCIPNGCSDGHKNDYAVGNSPSGTNLSTTNSVTTNGTEKTVSMSILSPFDEQEEWTKISEIMASFKNGIDHKSIVTELEQEFESRLGFSRADNNVESTQIVSYSSVGQWLQSIGFADLENGFVNFGYDDINFINGVINDCDLHEIGVMNKNDRDTIFKQCSKLPNQVGNFWAVCKVRSTEENNVNNLVKDWLNSINLGIYLETFRKNSYTDMEKIKRIWEVELTAFLDINKPGHRRRILASVNEGKSQSLQQQYGNDLLTSTNLEDVHADLEQLKSNIQEELEEEIRTKRVTPINTGNISNCSNSTNNTLIENSGTFQRRKKSRPAPPPPLETDLEIRNPSELLVGVPATLKAQWRHKPNVLVTGTVDYIASYLGSTVVKELRGTESTKKSIQKLKKSTSVVDCRTTPEIILAISYRGVKFLQVSDHSLICEHEIRNIHCACQDSEDLTHFAYITKDRASKTHYCHVFCVQTMDQATEVILTLGEAFEVAYQMALKEHFGNTCNGHTTSNSTTSINLHSSHVKSAKRIPPCNSNFINGAKEEDLVKLFVKNKDGHYPVCILVTEGRFQEIKKLFGIGNISDVKVLKRIVLSIGNKIFREKYKIEKDVADEVFVNVINELNYRSENTTQLSKYYHLSYSNRTVCSRNSDTCSLSPNVEIKAETEQFDQLFVKDKDKIISLWMLMIEEKYEEIKRFFNAETLSDTEMFKRIILDVGNKTFRETHRVEKDVADEIFECAADEIMAREGTMTQLLEYYNNSYN